MIANTIVQETARPSLHDTWVRYGEMFDCLDNAKTTLNALTRPPDWLRDVQIAVENTRPATQRPFPHGKRSPSASESDFSTRHGIDITNIIDEGRSEMTEMEVREIDIEEDEEEKEDETEVRKSLDEWLKSWEKKEK